jgi:hypothetical protein
MDFDALERLGRLRDSGAITADEFESEKRRILGGSPEPAWEPADAYSPEEMNDRGNGRVIMIALAVLAASGAGFFAYKSFADGPPEDALPQVSGSANATSSDNRPLYKVSSEVSGVRISATTTLPRSVSTGPVDDYCTNFVIEPKSDGAAQVQQAGWHVTGESRIGELTTVSFAGHFEPGTSGTCFVKDPNIAFFAGSVLQAIAYGESIGTVEPLTDDRVRIWGNDMGYASAVADVVQRENRLTVTPLGRSDLVCSGDTHVPNTFDTEIAKARTVLARAGWAPVPQSDEPDLRTAGLRELGIVEAESCSGTGYGRCTFIYKDESGRGLTITTVGDDPVVQHYGVEC